MLIDLQLVVQLKQVLKQICIMTCKGENLKSEMMFMFIA